MKYCCDSTLAHPFPSSYINCVLDINALIAREGYNGNLPLFLNNEKVIDLDEAEKIDRVVSGRTEQNKSMDLAFGIKNVHDSKVKIVLVELKFNMTDFYYLRKNDLEEKVLGSRILLSDPPPIYKRYIFIFQSKHLQEAISRIYRMVPQLESNYFAMDIHHLKNEYFE